MMRIDDIAIGTRHRRDLGDIGELGLLHPVVVDPSGRLIAGERRLAACRKLGWTGIPVTIVDIPAIARGEAVSIRRALEPKLKAAAKERQGMRTDLQHCGNLPQGETGKSRDQVAAFTGFAARTLDKATAIVAAAEAEPERFAKLVDDMDRTGRVAGAWHLPHYGDRQRTDDRDRPRLVDMQVVRR